MMKNPLPPTFMLAANLAFDLSACYEALGEQLVY